MIDKKKKSLFIVFGIVAVVYIIVFCAIPFHKEASSWVAFAFGLISIAGSCFIAILALEKGEDIKSKVYGFPILKLGYAYIVSQMLVTIIVSVTAAFIDTPVWIPLVVSIILVGIVSIGLIATESARDVIEKQDDDVKVAIKQMTMFKLDIGNLVNRCKTPEVKKEMEKLEEKLRYSDPVSNDDLAELEKQISTRIVRLGNMLEKDNQETMDEISEISRLIDERNRMCKAFK